MIARQMTTKSSNGNRRLSRQVYTYVPDGRGTEHDRGCASVEI